MTDRISFPPLHDPQPGELERRKQHLLSEITCEHGSARFTLPHFAFPRLRVAALAGVTVAVAAGGAAIAVVLSSSSGAKAAPLLVQQIHGSDWNTAVVRGGRSSVVTTSVGSSSPTAETTEVIGGTAGQRTLLQAIVAGMQPTVISEIEISGSGNDVALHFTAPWSSWSPAIWEDTLIAAAFRDRANAAGDNLTVSTFDSEANGARLPPGPATLPPAKPGDAAAAKQLFDDAAARIGVPLEGLTVYQPDGVAVAATLKSDDPASFLVHQMPLFLAALRPQWNSYDGVYVSLVDGSGQTVWETSWNQRISQGSVGSRPDLAGCSPVQNWGPTPAPCPAS